MLFLDPTEANDYSYVQAQMAELVDALASGASELMLVEVRVFFWAPYIGDNMPLQPAPFKNGRFINPYRQGSPKKFSLLKVLKWRLFSKRVPWPKHVDVEIQSTAPIAPAKGLQITFINHATFLLQTPTLTLLTDPVWSKRVSPVGWAGPKRVHEPGIPLAHLPKIDVILLTHTHYDHMDKATLAALIKRDNPQIITGAKSGVHFNGPMHTHKLTCLNWGGSLSFKDFTFTFTPAHHWTNRSPYDVNTSLWGGFLLTNAPQNSPHQAVYFAGDTAYGDGAVFRDIKAHLDEPPTLSLALAFLPIGAYLPRDFMKNAHMNPEEAVLAHQILQPRQTIPFHYGTFRLSDEGYDQPLADLEIALQKHKLPNHLFQPLKIGQPTLFDLDAAPPHGERAP